MGLKTVRFRCHSCRYCCTEVVLLPTPWDVIQIVKATKRRPLEFLEFLTESEIDEVEDDDPTWLECADGHYMMAVKRSEKKGCVFLNPKTALCSIYEARPILCRLFPLALEEDSIGEFKGFTLHDDVLCPRHQDGVLQCDEFYRLYLEDNVHQEAYRELVEQFNEGVDENTSPEQFLDLFVEISGSSA